MNEFDSVKVVIILDQKLFPETEEIIREVLREALSRYPSYSDDRVFVEPCNFSELKLG